MGSTSKLGLKRRLHGRTLACGACAVTAFASGAAALLVTAPGSQAQTHLSARAVNQATIPAGFRRRTASWYWDDGLSTACGFTANYGVANKRLPCGTHVTFWRAGYRVRAVVDDRGPYIAGRTWDLDEHTARALHFRRIGVGYVWAKW
jgi:rare lipoprotein A (peptidoglycan hydrolase)